MLKFYHQIELREEAVPIKHPWGGMIQVTTQGVRKEGPIPSPQMLCRLVFGDALGKRESPPKDWGYAFFLF